MHTHLQIHSTTFCMRSMELELLISYTKYVSGFEKSGHIGPDLNFEILICSENVGNQLSFDAYFMVIAAWIHFLCAFI